MDECKHIVSQNDRCVDCGKLIYTTEKRTCSQCKCFKLLTGGIPSNLPICRKKLMTVLSDMHVYYRIEEGTCFEE